MDGEFDIGCPLYYKGKRLEVGVVCIIKNAISEVV